MQEGSAGQPTASSFHQLLAPFEYLRPGQEHRSSPLSVEGRLVVKRVLGRRLAFFDLQSLAPGEDAVLQLRLLLREWERLHPLPDQADQLSPPISEISAEENEEDTKAKEKERSFYWATKHLKPGDIVGMTSLMRRASAIYNSCPQTECRGRGLSRAYCCGDSKPYGNRDPSHQAVGRSILGSQRRLHSRQALPSSPVRYSNAFFYSGAHGLMGHAAVRPMKARIRPTCLVN